MRVYLCVGAAAVGAVGECADEYIGKVVGKAAFQSLCNREHLVYI